MTERHRAELAQGLERLGYAIHDKPRQGFEIEGVPRDLMERFSTRALDISHARTELKERNEFLSTRDASIRTREDKQKEPGTYREYLEWQRGKLTQAERLHLKQTVEMAYEHSHKLRLNIQVAEGEENAPRHRLTYGQGISM